MLQGVAQRRQWRSKASGRRPGDAQNHPQRNFSAEQPNTKWLTDITYIHTAKHWLYLCEARADIFDYIERCHNPRQRRRMEMQDAKDKLLTQPSVITG